jgi:tRNA(Ile)-lysidine synthase
MFATIDRFIQHHQLLTTSTKVVVGLSGGPDSVFLLHFLAQKKKEGHLQDLVAAHLDHGWRATSHKDVEFCREMTQHLGISFFVSQKLSDLAVSLKFNGSQEEVGRHARRFFFEQVCQETQADVIALAHHAQDQQETFFIRMLRGASLSGLSAMRPRHGLYIRPLLEINKVDMLAFLDAHNIPYLIDPTNTSDDYLRNRIRNHVLPALEHCDQRFDAKFATALNSIQASDDFLTKLTHEHFAALAQQKNGTWVINVKQLLSLDPIFHQRILIHWFCREQIKFPTSSAFFDEAMRFMQQPDGGSHALSTDWKLVKRRGDAFILR